MSSTAVLGRFVLSGALTASALLVGGSAAVAAPDAPANLAVSVAAADGGSARVTWDRVTGATGYTVQIDNDMDFSSPLANQSTVNDVYVTPTQMPTAVPLYVRVQTKQDTVNSPWSDTVVSQRTALAAPANALPVDNTLLTAGTSPSFAWDAVPGATNYQVRIATSFSSECESSQVKTGGWTSESTQFVVRDRVLAPAQPYYWCVRASLPNSVNSEWTSPSKFALGDLGQPAIVGPTDPEATAVRDVALDWNPIDGAASYRLQVGWDQEFSDGIRFDTTLKATSWSPNPNILDNRTWYWRVAAIDASGNQHPWGNTFHTFVRKWTDQASLQYPANDEIVPMAEMYYEWSAIPRADYYTLQTAWDADFTSGLTDCRSSHTTYVGECGGNPNGWTYWRVRGNEDNTLGIDGSGNSTEHVTQTEVGSAPVRRYKSVIVRPTKTAPSYGAALDADAIPTLTWNPVTFAATYIVKLTNVGTGDVITKATSATAFTPRTLLEPGTYAWDVVPKTIDGVTIDYLALPDQSTFSVVSYSASNPVSGSPSLLNTGVVGYRAPTLAWQPVANATRYVVQVKPIEDTGWQQLSESFAYPAGQDSGTGFLAPGTYSWKVLPFNINAPLAESAPGTFTIKPLYDPTSPTGMSYGEWLDQTKIEAALSGNAMYGNVGETKDRCELMTASTGCANLRQTPVLHWQPRDDSAENPNIAFYRLALYADQAMSTPISIKGLKSFDVRRHIWLPTTPIADAQAGQEGATSAYWVRLIPCSYAACATAASSDPTINADLEHAFNKSYNRAVTSSPANGAIVPVTSASGANDLVFSWEDMVDAESAADRGDTTLKNSHADTSAVKYQLRYGRTTDLSSATTVTVDHTFYTPPTPLGDGDIYWQVRALDDDDNPLNWSAQAHFRIVSPQTTGLTPSTASTAVSGRQTLNWTHTAYAPKYAIEVYAGGEPQGTSTTDRKVADTVFGTSWTPATLLAPGLYTWRVRGIDASGNLMSWSAWSQFTVAPDSPTQLDAPSGADIAPQDLVMSWTAVPGATSYKAEWRAAGSASISSATTSGLAWAPVAAIGSAGDWEWRVTAMRGSTAWGTATEWRPFQVALRPTATTAVSIPTAAVVGSSLVATPPVWDFTNSAATTYQWFRGSTPIADATGTTYVVTETDFGKAIKVVATIKVPGYLDGTSTSNAVTPTATGSPSATTMPVISGDPHADSTLTVTTEATWSNGAATTYQWLRDGNSISGKTGLTYVIQGSDAGHTLAVRATGRLTGHADGVVISNNIAALAGVAATNSTAPVITGGTAVGSTLSLSTPPTWDRSGTQVTANCTKYEWLRAGTSIAGATSATYKTVDADADNPVSVRVTCVQTGYDTSAPIGSNAITPVLGPAAVVAVAPTVTGTPVTGQRLEATTGTWTPSTSETKYTYQWLRSGVPIAGATSSRYTATTADVGLSIAVTVTSKTPGFAPGQATSAGVIVSLAPNAKVSSTTTLTRSAAKVRKGKKVTLSAEVSASGRTGLGTVTIEIRIPGRSTVKTKVVTLSASNTATTKVKLKVKGKYQFRAVYKGITNVTASSSAWVKVKSR